MPTNKNKNKTVLVTGATGRQGGAVLRHLKELGFGCRALTRDPSSPKARALVGHGVEVARGDMEDEASLTRALDGVHGVFAVLTPYESSVEGEIRQGNHLIGAAKRSRITHFVYSSVGSADQKTGVPHFDSKFRIEEILRGTGMHYTILRPVFFMDNLLGMRDSIEDGVLRLPLNPETRLQMIAVDDIGGVAAAAFARPGKWQERALDIAGDELSMTDLAKALSRVAGREVAYEQVPWGEFESKAGQEMAVMYRWFQDVGYRADLPTVREEYPKVTSFDRWLNANWHTATRTA